jgi:uncharacterized protein YndB with AHSA1/START domain
MRITVEKLVKAELSRVWEAWNNPADIQRWNAASEDWHTSRSTVDLREGGKISARMEAKDGSEGFDEPARVPEAGLAGHSGQLRAPRGSQALKELR